MIFRKNGFYFFLAMLVFFGVQCQGNEAAKESKANAPELVAPKDGRDLQVFQVDSTASLLTITTLKDGDVPVKGTLNLKEGRLQLDGEQESSLSIDFSTWDSGLFVRDDRVQKIFFGILPEKAQIGQVTIGKNPIANLAELRSKGMMTMLKLPIELEAFERKIKRDVRVGVKFNQDGSLLVKSVSSVIVKISELGLTEGLKTLMDICDHKSVDDEVKVDFYVKFIPQK